MNRPAFPILLTLLSFAAVAARAQDTFASSVVGSANLSTNPLYSVPTAALGQPTTLINDPGGGGDVGGTYHASMVFPPFNKDPSGNNLLVSLGSSGQGLLTVKFDTPITHSDAHWYGDDFIVYGNSFFATSGASAVTPTTDMSAYFLSDGSIYQNGVPTVSVSADNMTYVPLTPQSPFYPTNPYRWAGISAQNPSGWDDSQLNDFTRPVDPTKTPTNFTNVSVATAANSVYNGAAGGEAFSLAGSGLDSIQYVRFTGRGAIDGVARVSTQAIPESGTLWILMPGLLALAGIAFRRRQTADLPTGD